MNQKKMTSSFLCFVLMLLLFGSTVYAQTITVNGPAAGATWYKGQTYQITWTKSGAMDANVKIRLRNSTSTTQIMAIVDSIPNNGTYSWTVPNSVANGNYVVRILTMDNAEYADSGVFTIAPPPAAASITVTGPAAAAVWKKESCYNITWTKIGSMAANVKMRLRNSSSTTQVLEIVNSTANDGSYNWCIPATLPTGQYVVRILTVDDAVYSDSAVFTVAPKDEGDTGIDWDRIRDKIKGMLEAEIVPWWRIKGPWPWPPDPNPCRSCEFEFDFGKIRTRLDELGLKGEIGVELFGQDGKLGDLGMIGKGRRLSSKFGQSKLSQRLQHQLVSGKGFKLVFKNKAGEIIHTQAINIKEQMKQMR